MRKITPKFFVSCLSSLLILSSAAIADTTPSTSKTTPTTEKPVAENVEINSRPLPKEIKTMMDQQRVQEAEQANNADNSNNKEEGCKCRKNKPPKNNAQVSNATKGKTNLNILASFSAHWITSFSLTGDIIEMEDGSQWGVAVNQIYKVQSWRVGDNISITPNYNPFSNYNYYIVNNSTGSYVAVTPFVGPLAFGPNSNWVVGLDFMYGQVSLLNGNGDASIWQISNSDYYLFSTWAINDTIIVGDNDSWLYALSPNEYILINVNMNHYVRCRQL